MSENHELSPIPRPHFLPAIPAELIDLMGQIKADVTERTWTAYEKDYRDFAAFLEAPDAAAALRLLISLNGGQANELGLAYRSHMQLRGLKPATIGRRLAALKKAVKVARMGGRVDWALETPSPKAERTKDVRGPGLLGFARMLAALDRRTDAKGIRDRAMLRLLWGLALRRMELVNIDWPEDVDLDGNRVAVRGKGRTSKDWLTLPDGAKGALVAWLDVRGREPGPVFVSLHTGKLGGRLDGSSVFRIVQGLGVDAGLERATRPHAIRHASITEVAKRTNGNLPQTQKFGRHTNPATTSKYIDEFDDTFGKMANLVDDALDG